MNPHKPGNPAILARIGMPGQNMRMPGDWAMKSRALVTAMLAGFLAGCHATPKTPPPFPTIDVPKELKKSTHPTYTIEAPDILYIEATRVIPLPPYKVQPLDALFLNASGLISTEPIQGIYPVEPDGTINLGIYYGGNVRVIDLSTADIEKKLTAHLRGFAKDANVTVSLASSRGSQLITGQHLLQPDGTVNLGVYGNVYVAGMTVDQAKAVLETHLAKFLYRPEISISVYAFNSKYYYVITDFAGSGEQVVRLPAMGNETVLDAIANIGGLSAVSSKKIWIARPAPSGCADQILPVDWKGITRRGHTGTNYQVLPGDRVFVMGSPLSKFDTILGRTLAPVERMLGTALLATSFYQQTQGEFFGQ